MRILPLLFLLSLPLAAEVVMPPFITCTEYGNPVTGRQFELRVLGPLFELFDDGKAELSVSVRPLFGFKKSERESGMEAVWPLAATRSKPSGDVFWVFPYFRYTGPDQRGSGNFVAPLCYWAHRADGSWDWLAFPFAGDVNELFSLGHTRFLLFPLLLETRKNGMDTRSVLWPLFSRSSGRNEEKIRLLPFYASRRIDGLRWNQAWLWPLLTTAHSLSPDMPGYAFFSLPLGGYEQWGKFSGRSVFWPFFTWKSHADSSFSVNAPWPFFRYGRGVHGESVLYFWPLWGRSVSAAAHFSFWLWPVGWYSESRTSQTVRTWQCVLPLYWSMKSRDSKSGKDLSRWHHVWPLVSVVSENGRETVRVPDLMPLKRVGALERNYAPLWTLFQLDSGEDGYSFDFLWGMFGWMNSRDRSRLTVGPFYTRYVDREKDFSESQVFFGMVRTRTSPEKNTCTLFYVFDFSF